VDCDIHSPNKLPTLIGCPIAYSIDVAITSLPHLHRCAAHRIALQSDIQENSLLEQLPPSPPSFLKVLVTRDFAAARYTLPRYTVIGFGC